MLNFKKWVKRGTTEPVCSMRISFSVDKEVLVKSAFLALYLGKDLTKAAVHHMVKCYLHSDGSQYFTDHDRWCEYTGACDSPRDSDYHKANRDKSVEFVDANWPELKGFAVEGFTSGE